MLKPLATAESAVKRYHDQAKVQHASALGECRKSHGVSCAQQRMRFGLVASVAWACSTIAPNCTAGSQVLGRSEAHTQHLDNKQSRTHRLIVQQAHRKSAASPWWVNLDIVPDTRLGDVVFAWIMYMESLWQAARLGAAFATGTGSDYDVWTTGVAVVQGRLLNMGSGWLLCLL